MLTINDVFPDFQLTAVVSADRNTAFQDLSLNDLNDQWKIIFFWPKDFTFVCPTEIMGFGKLDNAFKQRNTQLIGASTDSDYVHFAWREHNSLLRDSPFPWLADIKKELAGKLGILDEESGVARRATFIVGPDNVIRHVSVNADKVGRNPQEMLRILDALQTDELCACDWQIGEETLGA